MMKNVGVVLEILGAFLLAVEAIKVQNIKAIAERLRDFEQWFNPRIVFVDRKVVTPRGRRMEVLGYQSADCRADT
jgi:hypothetical protein